MVRIWIERVMNSRSGKLEGVAREILTKLYLTLERNERQWYTRQVPVMPTIVVTADHDLNAFAETGTNKIFVNLGLFEFAESLARINDVTRWLTELAVTTALVGVDDPSVREIGAVVVIQQST